MRKLLVALALALIAQLADARQVSLLKDVTATNPANLDTGVLSSAGCQSLLITAYATVATATNVTLSDAATGYTVATIASLTAATVNYTLSQGVGVGATAALPPPARIKVVGTTGASGTLRVRIECSWS